MEKVIAMEKCGVTEVMERVGDLALGCGISPTVAVVTFLKNEKPKLCGTIVGYHLLFG